MDPFIESQEWSDFHPHAIAAIADDLNPRLRGHYVARIERRVYIEHPGDPDSEVVIPDVVLAGQSAEQGRAISTNLGTMANPVTRLLAMPEERRESYLVVKKLGDGRVVTMVELLSPSNKRRGSGRDKYLSKREQVLNSPTHLVEFDLLRGGLTAPMQTPLPPGDYHAIVSDARKRPRADVYTWRLDDRLTEIRLPLAQGDPDISLDIQTILDQVYDHSGYDQTLDYSVALDPSVNEDTQRWITEILETRFGANGRN